MYKINCDKKILHDMRDDELQVINPSLSLELNSFGKLNFSILNSHQNKDYIKKLISDIEVFDDDKLIFSGRSLTDEKDFYLTGQVYCEGELAFLLDSISRPYEIHDLTVRKYLEMLINSHNEQVEDRKKFILGIVDVVDTAGDGLLYRKNEGYVSTWNEIKDKLINRLGGYLRVRHDGDIRYLDYVQQYGKKNTQTIMFGENILDLTQFTSAEDIATVVIPLGAKNETGEYLTIETINNGKDYIEDEAGVSLWGRIVKTIEFEDVTLPTNLISKAREYLENSINLALTIELTALDLGLLNVDIEKIRLGDSIRVISKFHNLDSWFTVTKLDIDLVNPQNNKITLGKTLSTLTEEQLNSVKEIQSTTNKLEENLNDVKVELQQTKEGLSLKISEEDFNTLFEQTTKEFNFTIGDENETTNVIINKEGLTVRNGAIAIKNKNGNTVMWVDENGNLSVNTLVVFGDGSNTINFKGKGRKSINFQSEDAKSLFINFLRGTDTNTRIGVYAQDALSDRSYQFFIEPGSTTKDNEPMVIIRGANSTSEENEMSILQVHGDIQAIRDLIIGTASSGNQINVREELNKIKAAIVALGGKI